MEILRQNPKRRKVENKSTIGKNICSSNVFTVTFHLIFENKSNNIVYEHGIFAEMINFVYRK